MSFTEDTVTLTVDASAKLLSVTFPDGRRTETAISLADLKAGDIVQYTLKSGTKTAVSITRSSMASGGAD